MEPRRTADDPAGAPSESPSRFAHAGRALTLALALVFLWMAWGRFENVHHRTFDLAFYGRLSWGLAVFDGWDPLQHANVLGLHLSLILIPLGWLGRVFGTVPVLLTAQVAAVAGAALLLGRLAHRHLGRLGWLVGPLVFLGYPNISHVVSYEWHPGTMAVLPLAWALERLDASDRRGVVWASLGVLACREDLALVTALLGLLLAWPARPWSGPDDGRGDELHSAWRTGLALAAGSLAYLALFAFVLHPRFAPAEGSFQAHFGHLGDGAADAVANVLADPLRLLAHVDRAKLTWLPRVLAPLAFLPLVAPRLAIPALPVLGVAFFSAFHTTANLDSHYLTTALPPLVAAALVGAGRVSGSLAERRPLLREAPGLVLASASLVGWALAGQGPTDRAFHADRQTVARRIVLDSIPDRVSVQAPAPLLPHLVERNRLHMGWQRDEGAEYVVLDLWHRERYRGREVLLRTSEEPTMRSWLARPELAVVAHSGSYVVLRRGLDPRGPESIAGDYLLATGAEPAGEPLTDCLRVVGARRLGAGEVALELHATGPCPADLALRIDGRVDLLFDGLLSPAHLRAGDRLRSDHVFAGDELALATLRSSGARPRPVDPERVLVPLGDKIDAPQSTSGR